MGGPYSVVVIIYFTFIHQRISIHMEIDLHRIYYFIDPYYNFQDKGIAERVAQRNWQ